MGLPIMNKLKKDDSGGKNLGSSFTGPDYKYQDFIKSTVITTGVREEARKSMETSL